MRIRLLVLGLFLTWAALIPASVSLGTATPAPARMPVPAGFTDTVIVTGANLDAPTAMTWLPDGRMLVTQQSGEVRLYNNGGGASLATFDLGNRVCSDFERGLLGIALHPNFAASPYVYLFYTFNKFNEPNPSQCAQRTANTAVNRVSRFRWENDALNIASEEVLVDNMISYGGNHNAGDVAFGKDGKLYISIGDGGTDYAGGGGGGANDAARDKHVLTGKILRVNDDGTIPADNPFLGAGTVRCNVTGRNPTAGNHCQETWAWGLRNPFRFAMDPDAAGTRLYINDVGQNAREEIDLGQAGADYGWNCMEGTRVNNTSGPCNPTPPNMVPPIHEYDRTTGCASITGGAFVPDAAGWPAAYDNGYLFSDYACGKIFLLQGTTRTEFATGLGGSSAVHLAFGPFGSRRAFYYTSYAGGGEVHRVTYNQATAAFSATPTSGPAPLAVQFDGRASTSSDGSALTFNWNYGDGTPTNVTPNAQVSHTYAAAGVYTATLSVRDGANQTSGTVNQRIVVGNSAPVATINTPTAGTTYAVGQSITLLGSATDPQDGPLAPSRLGWRVLLHHDQHTHPLLSAPATNTATFVAPPPEDLLAATNSFLEIELTATDSGSLSTVVTRTINPRKVNLTFNTTPDNLTLRIGDSTINDGQTVVSWENWDLSVQAPLQKLGNRWLRFQSWGNGSQQNPRVITTPAGAASYTATFVDAYRLHAPILKREY